MKPKIKEKHSEKKQELPSSLSTKKHRGIESKLDIEPIAFNIPKLTIVVGATTREDLKHDYGFIREKLLNALNKGDQILDQALSNAQFDVSPRSIEAASAMLGTICSTTKELFNMHKMMIELKKELGDFEKEIAVHENDGTTGKPKTVKANINDIIDAGKNKDHEE